MKADDNTMIVGGDFNLTLDEERDRIRKNNNPTPQSAPRAAARLEKIIEDHSLCDAFIVVHPNQTDKDMTWTGTQNNAARLDRFYISSNMVPKIQSCESSPDVSFADHLPVVLQLGQKLDRGQHNIRKILDIDLLDDAVFVQDTRALIQKTLTAPAENELVK